jgi:NAD(P)-dependent dehydrogenase (short-subunit alcohol dehydrogenase family)
MTRREDVQRLAGAAVAAMGKIDILVNNAGAIDQIRDDRPLHLRETPAPFTSRSPGIAT